VDTNAKALDRSLTGVKGTRSSAYLWWNAQSHPDFASEIRKKHPKQDTKLLLGMLLSPRWINHPTKEFPSET